MKQQHSKSQKRNNDQEVYKLRPRKYMNNLAIGDKCRNDK